MTESHPTEGADLEALRESLAADILLTDHYSETDVDQDLRDAGLDPKSVRLATNPAMVQRANEAAMRAALEDV